MRLPTALVVLALLSTSSVPGDATPDRPPGATAASADPTVWSPPVDPLVVVRGYKAPAQRWAAGNRGVDLATTPGQAVFAPVDGTVTVITGRRSSVEPVLADVATGAVVRRGQQVGVVVASPASHCAPDSCVHWGVRHGQDYLDPLTLLAGTGPIVLLPGPDP